MIEDHEISVEAIALKLSEWKRGSIDLNLLMNSCPFRLRKAEYSL